ncbi:MAG: BlaI/MecI/CopY family transcriptional regulator [Myxococcota bacterium]
MGAPTTPSHAELEILQALWARGIATVREVHEDIQIHRAVGYTTTLKQIQRMEEKDLVEKVAADSRSHRYRAKLKPKRTRAALLERLVNSAFAGSTSSLVLHALGRAKPNKQQIEEIRAVLDELDQDP